MYIKTLAIAAAAVMTAGAAQAADLGKPVKAAVDYVKVCDAYGAGFFYIPGGDTCLKIAGYVRAEFAAGSSSRINDGGNWTYTQGGVTTAPIAAGRYQVLGTGNGLGTERGQDNFQSHVRTHVEFDARSNTDFGVLRSFISTEVNFSSNTSSTISLDKGYIQWGGLTAGRAESMFEFYFGTTQQLFFSEVFPDQSANLLAYTFSFGNGVTATLSLEDSTTGTRTQGTAQTAAGVFAPATFGYQGNKAPDVVANLNVTQAWGAAQISAALHNVYGQSLNIVSGAGVNNVNKWGYALLAGVKINLPMLGAGDTFGIQGTYTEGAVAFATSQWFKTNNLGVDAARESVGNVIVGDVKLTKAWAVGAGFDHNFSSTVDWAINGGVAGFNGAGALDYTEYSIGTTLAWKPVKGFQIAPSIEYRSDVFTAATKANTAFSGVSKNTDAWIVGVRFQRDF